MMISFSKSWGQDGYPWNYCGGDFNFRTLPDFMLFYGIKEARITGNDTYSDPKTSKILPCYEYSGWATKQLDRLRKHWAHQFCRPCVLMILRP